MKLILPVIGLCFFLAAAAVAYAAQSGQPDPGLGQSGPNSNAGQDMNRKETIMTKDPHVVMQVQQALSNQGYYNGAADGKWDSNTQKAVKKFQQTQGMTPTGQLDQQTLASLKVQGGAAAGGTQDRSSSEQTGTGSHDSLFGQGDRMTGR